MTVPILAHLWQSTLFALAAAAVAGLLRRHRADVRFGVWLAASLKFLVPFAVLVRLGSHLRWPAAAAPVLADKFVATLGGPVIAFAALPLRHGAGAPAAQSAAAASAGPGWLWALAAVWAGGASLILFSRLRAWRRLQRLLRSSLPLTGDAGLPVRTTVRTSQGELEPGVVGWRHPVLLLPQGIAERLSAAELAAVLAHERNHLRRRDNLWSVLHMLVETLFWFYPVVWWIGARLLRERERACDEAVLSQGHAAAVYAGAILNVCRHYAESPLTCVAGITGADLRDRVEGIVRGRVGRRLGRGATALLAAAATLALALPILAGVGRAQPVVRLARLFTVPQRIAPAPAQLPAVAAAPAPAPAATPQKAPQQLQAPPDRRLIVFYFDLSTMAAKDVDNAVQSAENYVDKQLTPNSMVSVAELGSALNVLQDFTADPARLHTVLEGVAGRGGGSAGGGTSSFNVDGSAPDADRSLRALMTMCQMLEPIQRKKSILFFSDGITRQGSDSELTLRSAVNACVKADVSIYSFDARGLVQQIPAGVSGIAGTAPNGTVTVAVSGAACNSCNPPAYPEIARHAHLQGEVVLMVAIGTDGKVLNEGVEGSPNIMLATAARSAVHDWTFQAPASPSNAKVTVTFQLETTR